MNQSELKWNHATSDVLTCDEDHSYFTSTKHLKYAKATMATLSAIFFKVNDTPMKLDTQ